MKKKHSDKKPRVVFPKTIFTYIDHEDGGVIAVKKSIQELSQSFEGRNIGIYELVNVKQFHIEKMLK